MDSDNGGYSTCHHFMGRQCDVIADDEFSACGYNSAALVPYV
jgi:hypothetical protein